MSKPKTADRRRQPTRSKGTSPLDHLSQEYALAPIDSVSQHPLNANVGNAALIRESISVTGFYGAVIVQRSTGHILAGNHRWKELRDAGAETVPVIYVDADDKQALRILTIDNESTRDGRNDKAKLAAILQLLAESPEGLKGTGYTATDLDRITAGLKPPSERLDVAPAKGTAQERWQTAPGQTWRIGDHTLAIGDATDPETWRRATRGELVDLVAIDPPYGVDVNAGWAPGYRRQDGKKIQNDRLQKDALAEFLLESFRACFDAMRPGAVIYVCHAEGSQLDVTFRLAFRDAGFYGAAALVWLKETFVLSRQDYHWRHEPILYGWRPDLNGSTAIEVLPAEMPEPTDVASAHDPILYGWKPGAGHYWCGDRDQDTVWTFPRPKRSPEHPTMKPVALMLRMIRNSSKVGDLVADCFAGSGTTMIACQEAGRRCAAIELDPEYAAVVLERMRDLYGIEGRLEE